MRYRVHGAVSATGHELSTTVTANSTSEAEEIARKRGILVSHIELNDGDAGNGAVVTSSLPVDSPPEKTEPQFRFRKGEAFAFGFYAGWGVFCVVCIVGIIYAFLKALIAVNAWLAR